MTKSSGEKVEIFMEKEMEIKTAAELNYVASLAQPFQQKRFENVWKRTWIIILETEIKAPYQHYLGGEACNIL